MMDWSPGTRVIDYANYGEKIKINQKKIKKIPRKKELVSLFFIIIHSFLPSLLFLFS